MIRLGVLALLCSASAAFAKIEMPPELRTEDERQAYAQRIRTELHEVYTSKNYRVATGNPSGLLKFITNEQNLVAILLQDTEYVRLADERPELQTFSFRRVVFQERTGRGVSRAWTDVLERAGYQVSADSEASLKELQKVLE